MRRCLLLALFALWIGPALAAEPVVVGSKKFTESVILGEIGARLIESTGTPVRHRRELGGTRVLWDALVSGEIDVYPEYSGTLANEILGGQTFADSRELEAALSPYGIRMTQPLGFNNSYALGMVAEKAAELGIIRISDLALHPTLAFGFSNEFMDRPDGWPGLREHYDLNPQRVRGLDHHLAYRGLVADKIQVTDLYSTDAEIPYYRLRVLEDDRGFFPEYRAVLLYRIELEEHAPEVVTALRGLADRINSREMSTMNARAKLDEVPEGEIAAHFVRDRLGLVVEHREEGAWSRLWRHTREHLLLVGVSLSAAIAVSVPLGVLAWARPRAGQIILSVAGLIQTIPSLALLVFMIPLLGIGGPPAVLALFLYSLLPIIRNTYTGLSDIPRSMRESAEAMGLPPGARLSLVELPLASRAILGGIKTSAVINVGTATLGALIGAGGYGQPILTGIRLDDTQLILEGALPAATLALLVQGLFDLAERRLLPDCLRPLRRPR